MALMSAVAVLDSTSSAFFKTVVPTAAFALELVRLVAKLDMLLTSMMTSYLATVSAGHGISLAAL